MLGVLTLIVTWCQIAGFRANNQGSLPSLEVFKSNATSVIGRLTEVYSLRSSVCLDRYTFYHKYGCC